MDNHSASSASAPLGFAEASFGTQDGEYEPSPDNLTIAAYYRYIDHGSVPGLDVVDWLESERIIKTTSRHLERRVA